MTPFRERNPLPIGIIGIVAILLLLLLSFNASALPFIGGGTTHPPPLDAGGGPNYPGRVAGAGGLKSGDDVRIAGVKVGKVTSLSLNGAVVRVGFEVNTS